MIDKIKKAFYIGMKAGVPTTLTATQTEELVNYIDRLEIALEDIKKESLVFGEEAQNNNYYLSTKLKLIHQWATQVLKTKEAQNVR